MQEAIRDLQRKLPLQRRKHKEQKAERKFREKGVTESEGGDCRGE